MRAEKTNWVVGLGVVANAVDLIASELNSLDHMAERWTVEND